MCCKDTKSFSSLTHLSHFFLFYPQKKKRLIMKRFGGIAGIGIKKVLRRGYYFGLVNGSANVLLTTLSRISFISVKLRLMF